MLATAPTAATASITPPFTSGGASSLRAASTSTQIVSASNVNPLV